MSGASNRHRRPPASRHRRRFLAHSAVCVAAVAAPQLGRAEPITAGTVTWAFIKWLAATVSSAWAKRGAVTARAAASAPRLPLGQQAMRAAGSFAADALAESIIDGFFARAPRSVGVATEHDPAAQALWAALAAARSDGHIDPCALCASGRAPAIDWSALGAPVVQVLDIEPVRGNADGQFARQYRLRLGLIHPLEQTFDGWTGVALMTRDAQGWQLYGLSRD